LSSWLANGGMHIYDELESVWKEAVVAYFMAESLQFPRQTEENY